ncbi:hypothetical protein C8T65DRAFT_580269 [Cerioporus squamosus]|nr:hypothetical protein C8T65DRAFT_580269 [Cerioporus squamosus]
MQQMPTFGHDQIRRFWSDVSSRKCLAARDYEAFLMTIMPAFEGLLPVENDQIVADMLFELANWHALAKLRVHTTVTLDNLETATTHLYAAMRWFNDDVCAHYKAEQQLRTKAEACVRCQSAKNAHVRADSRHKEKKFNVLNTYKYHALGDYPPYIRCSGPTDNFNTQVVSPFSCCA